MLNPDLKLNENLFNEDVEKAATREGFGDSLLELAEVNPNIVVLCADVTESTQVHKFAERFPERYLEVGIAEQNMAGIAAGLAISGKIPFITSYAAFSPGKNLETIRTTCVYNQANVKIAGHHAGIVTGEDGATHQATEDIAQIRSMPGIDILVPCDYIEAKKITIASINTTGPIYMRFSRPKTPIITSEETPFEKRKMFKFWISDNAQVTIFATGHMTYHALLAAKELEEEGINTFVINTPTISPLSDELVTEFTKVTHAVVTVEDHQVKGGLGSAISESLAKSTPYPIEFIGLQNIFAESGSADELLKKYKMDKDAIKDAVKKVVSRK